LTAKERAARTEKAVDEMVATYGEMCRKRVEKIYLNAKTNLKYDLKGLKYSLMKTSSTDQRNLLELGARIVKTNDDLEKKPAATEDEFKTRRTFQGASKKNVDVFNAVVGMQRLGIAGYMLSILTKKEQQAKREVWKGHLKDTLRKMKKAGMIPE
jgi:N-methylhydantoinase B/oxoprolinase/acetone carboxylase alpha subunit